LAPALKKDPAARAGRFRNSNLAQAWLVLVLAMGFGTALAAVQVNLSGVIAANQRNETLEKIPELVLGPRAATAKATTGSAIKTTSGTIAVQQAGKPKTYTVYRTTQEGRPVGWVIKAGGQGYADKIELLLGLDPSAETITGLFILEQKETPGLGNNIIQPNWRNQFIGKQTVTALKVSKGQSSEPNAIDAITGATISSRAVTTIVNRTMGALRKPLMLSKVPFTERQE